MAGSEFEVVPEIIKGFTEQGRALMANPDLVFVGSFVVLVIVALYLMARAGLFNFAEIEGGA